MKIRTATAAALVALAAVTTGFAQGPSQDPPSRVARLNWLNGNVSFQPAGIDTWTAATLNYPLTTGDHIYTDVASRGEIHVGPNALRLNGESNFGFLNLDDRTVQARFTSGAVEIRLRRLEDDDLYEVDTPQGAVSLLRTGDYRIDTDPNRNATMITVWSGEADVLANGRNFVIHPRQTAYIPDGQDPDIREANPPDDFDAFTRDRNSREDRVPPPVHVSQSMVGYEDLDAYGAWRQSPDYGWVWAPRVAAGWAPYHAGRWAWVEPWGWTWIDEAPWGFAPFHYGRWAYAGAGWVWVPGTVVARPVYAPALVAFVGGPRFGLALGIGGGGAAVAWFPLGPREAFYPAYHVSNTYVQQVNITHVTNVNVTNITNVTNVRYVNQQVPGAVVAMPQQGFAGARSVREVGQNVQPQQLAQAQVIGSGAQVAPRRESLMGVQTNARVAAPSQAVMARAVVAKATPPPAAVSFQARQQAIQQNQGRPLAPDQMNQLRQQPGAVMNRPAIQPAIRSAQAPSPANNPAPAGRQFGRPADQPAPAVQQPAVQPAPAPRPADRFESRPPSARPMTPTAASPAPQQAAPQQAAPRPQVAQPVAPAPRPAEVARPRPVEAAPAPRAEAPRAEPPARQEHPAKPAKKEEKKEEKK